MTAKHMRLGVKSLIFCATALIVSAGSHASSVVCTYEMHTYGDNSTSAICLGPVAVTTPSDLATAANVLQQQITQQKADYDALMNKLDAVLKELENVKADLERAKLKIQATK